MNHSHMQMATLASKEMPTVANGNIRSQRTSIIECAKRRLYITYHPQTTKKCSCLLVVFPPDKQLIGYLSNIQVNIFLELF